MSSALKPSPPDAVIGLEQFKGRGAGTEAERQAAQWLARELEDRGREVRVESFWCRPNRALAQLWHAALALAGSLVAVASPTAGLAMLAVALVSVLADELIGISPGRRLTPEHASQNVVAHRPQPNVDGTRLHLIITANYDAGRTGLVYREGLRALAAGIKRSTGGLAPGWLAWLTLAIAWALGTAILRLKGHHSAAVGLVQLPPTVALLLAVGLLLELAGAEWSPGVGDNATGVEVALSLERALAVSPPRRLDVEVVLTGASDSQGIGLRRYLGRSRDDRRPDNTVVIGIAPCSAGEVRWWRSDGALLPLAFGARLLALARQLEREQPHLNAQPHRGRGVTPALPARRRGIPAITIGCLDDRDLVPRSHGRDDVGAAVDPSARSQALQFGLMLVDAIDAALQQPPERGRRRP